MNGFGGSHGSVRVAIVADAIDGGGIGADEIDEDGESTQYEMQCMLPFSFKCNFFHILRGPFRRVLFMEERASKCKWRTADVSQNHGLPSTKWTWQVNG